VREELDACVLELASATAKAAKAAEAAEAEKTADETRTVCVCSKLSDLAVRVWYMSGERQETEPEYEVTDAENAMSKQLMAVRALTQRLLVESKASDVDAQTSTECLELAAELVEFCSAPFADPVLGALARQMPEHFLTRIAKAGGTGRRRAARVMRVTLELARRGRDGPPLTLEEHVVVHAAGGILKRGCSEELMCLCDVVNPLEVLEEWRRESDAGNLEAQNAMMLIRVGKLVPQAYQIGAKRVLEKTLKGLVYFQKGAYIRQSEGPEDEPEHTLTRLLAYRATRALSYD
jgi:hypothetical protein